MDAETFDRLARALRPDQTRRALLGLLAGLPLGMTLSAVFGDAPETMAADDDHGSSHRRRRRKARHRHQTGNDKEHRKGKGKDKRKRKRTSPPLGCPVCQGRDGAGQCVADASQDRTICASRPGATSVCCNGSCCHGSCCQGRCCAGCCGRDGACGACLAFKTSTFSHQGNLGGLSGADAICTLRAGEANPPLPGTYMAWLSDDTGSPSTRFRCTQASCSSEGYRLVDGVTVVADDWVDLTDGQIDTNIVLTELGIRGGSTLIWTQTLPDGTEGGFVVDAHCSNWSSNSSLSARGGTGTTSSSTNFPWTQFGATGCSSQASLYCFQQS